MLFVVDKITNEVARLEAEDKSFIEVSCRLLPKTVAEGDVLTVTEGDGLTIRISEQETLARREIIKKYMDEVWED